MSWLILKHGRVSLSHSAGSNTKCNLRCGFNSPITAWLTANAVLRSIVHQREASLTFNDAHDGQAVVLANHGIGFPVTDSATCLDDSGAIFDTETFGYGATLLDLVVTLPTLPLAAQLLPQ